jgi:LuxR family transcriptional regulator, maltose regulon positive regulatory protein
MPVALLEGLGEPVYEAQRVLPLLRRSRLDSHLADGDRRPVTVVSGPPGSGKTTFVSAWTASRPFGSVGWLTVSAQHDDSRGLTAALRRTTSARGTMPGSYVVVVDGVEHLRSPGAADALRRFIGSAPLGLDVILLSRRPATELALYLPPPIVGEVDERELAFSAAETRDLFASCGLRLRRDDAVALWQWTEGWAACVMQLALAMSHGSDPHRLAQDEGAIESATRDYLATEVVTDLDDESQRLLLRTSIVDRVSRGLAAALAGDDGASHRLSTLELSGMLGSTLGGEWYGQRPLVAAHFRARLRREDPALAIELHGVAAEWFAERGMTHEAELHARHAENWDFFGELVARRWLASVTGAEMGSFPAIDELPIECISRSPRLAAVVVGEASTTGQASRADAYIDLLDAIDIGDQDELDDGTVVVLVARLLYGRAFGTTESAITAGQALSRDDLPENLRRFTRMRRVELLLDRGDLVGARMLLDELAQDATTGSNAEVEALLALLLALQGQARGALRVAATVVADREPLAADVSAVVSLAEVIARAQAGQRRRRRPLPDELVAETPLIGSRALATCLRAVRASTGEQTWLDFDTARHPLAARALVALGIVDVIDAAGASLPIGGPAEATLRQARASLLSGSPRSALAALEPWAGRTTWEVHPRIGAELATLSAVAAHALTSPDSAMSHLDTALDLAERHGVAAPLVEHGNTLGPLLSACATSSGRHQGLALLLLDTIEPTPSPAFIDALTDREIVVLQLLPALMSNGEIAEMMHVSINTVKTHLKSLYRKLGVDRRREAVVRARQLGLL